MCNCEKLNSEFMILLGVLIFIIGNFFIKEIFGYLRNKYVIIDAKIKETGGTPLYFRAAAWLGVLETFVYALAICISQVGFIGLWLGVKSIGRWASGGPNSVVDHLDLKEHQKRERKNAEINIYLIGNLLCVLLGVLVGIIWKASNWEVIKWVTQLIR